MPAADWVAAGTTFYKNKRDMPWRLKEIRKSTSKVRRFGERPCIKKIGAQPWLSLFLSFLGAPGVFVAMLRIS